MKMWRMIACFTALIALSSAGMVMPSDVIPMGTDWRFFEMEFQTEVEGGKSLCFFHDFQAGDTFEVTYEIVDGSTNLRTHIWDPNGNEVAEESDTLFGEIVLRNMTLPGVYKLCFVNMDNGFGEKLLDIFMHSYSRHSKMEQKPSDQDSVISESLYTLEDDLHDVVAYIAKSKQQGAADLHFQNRNKSHVQRMSILSCLFMVGTSALQVFFVRRLFREPNRRVKTGA